MTEDEAFIRAVVDGPGDDTPRVNAKEVASDNR